MAIQNAIGINLFLQGDGTSTVFTQKLSDLPVVISGGVSADVFNVSHFSHPDDVTVSQGPTGTTASISNGTLTITFPTALPAGPNNTTNIELHLLYNN